MACAASAVRSWPTMPRMSYCRKMPGAMRHESSAGWREEPRAAGAARACVSGRARALGGGMPCRRSLPSAVHACGAARRCANRTASVGHDAEDQDRAAAHATMTHARPARRLGSRRGVVRARPHEHHHHDVQVVARRDHAGEHEHDRERRLRRRRLQRRLEHEPLREEARAAEDREAEQREHEDRHRDGEPRAHASTSPLRVVRGDRRVAARRAR